MLFKFSLLLVSVAVISAEPPLQSAPYPAAGWRPHKPFNLPGEFIPPLRVEQQQFQQPQKFDIEISKERIDFAGQIRGNTPNTVNKLQSAYLPPHDKVNQNDDFLQVQSLPTLRRPYFLNKEEVLQRPVPLRGDQAPFSPNFVTQDYESQQHNFRPQLDEKLTFSSSKPLQQYGAPNSGRGQMHIVYPDPPNTQSNEEHNYNAIKELNAAIAAYNRAQLKKNAESFGEGLVEDDADNFEGNENPVNSGYPYSSTNTRYQQGQYYVLSPDNSIQRVMFTTSQNEEELKNNGFTAQLKYTPVGEIRDPVFKYNERGQLERVLKK